MEGQTNQPMQQPMQQPGPQQVSMNQTVNINNRGVNHGMWCLMSTCTGCVLLPCWVGACCGCCPKC